MRTLSKRLFRRKKRVSSRIRGSAELPRVSVHRSNKFLYAQVIDDVSRKTIASINTRAFEKSENTKKSDSARKAGEALASDLKSKNVQSVVFDRGRFTYNGRVKHFAEGLREGGITV
ncbi:MAG TPA: 50S ribosomal protein L18 [Candidatus Woesebacteria bacterium]|nr:50S ribosomal protein L18 [Candidatus Woesebacteria bacterium]HNS94678.1 50S ribosomal protein L18 [Candidatus Woesebacteria bacterium]